MFKTTMDWIFFPCQFCLLDFPTMDFNLHQRVPRKQIYLTLMDCVECDLAKFGICNWTKQAQDREGWKRIKSWLSWAIALTNK